MIIAHDNLETLVEFDGQDCRVETFPSGTMPNTPNTVGLALRRLWVGGVHSQRLRAAVNTAKPATDAELRRAVSRELIPQTTGEVAERILRACYD